MSGRVVADAAAQTARIGAPDTVADSQCNSINRNFALLATLAKPIHYTISGCSGSPGSAIGQRPRDI